MPVAPISEQEISDILAANVTQVVKESDPEQPGVTRYGYYHDFTAIADAINRRAGLVVDAVAKPEGVSFNGKTNG